MKCRHCGAELNIEFADLGTAPPSNSYLSPEMLQKPELFYPLRVKVCDKCWLVQTEDFARREDFFSPDYSYFSSFSKTWLLHAEQYVSEMVDRFELNSESLIVEIASNDGCLLQNFVALNIPCLGIEPTKSTALVSSQKGIPTICDFFGTNLAKDLVKEKKEADLIPANNVLAHVPDINDFLNGIKMLLKNNGVATFEFPHLLKLVDGFQFDTIYHEHYSYLSLISIQNIFKTSGLEVFDVEEISTHGGSLRIFAHKKDSGFYKITNRVELLLKKEMLAGIDTIDFYKNFKIKINSTKNNMLSLLLKLKSQKVIGYGAAAKGNTFLNFSGIRSDLIAFVVDKNPHKQNKFLPGSRIPIYEESYIKSYKPDYIIILPWNLKYEISNQLAYIREWGGKFIVAIPELEIF